MRKIKYKHLGYLIFIIVTIISISSCNDEKNVDIDFKIVRYDKLLFELDTNNIENEFDSLLKTYPAFTDIYFEKVFPIVGYKENDSLFFDELKMYISNSDMQRLYNLVQEEFGDMKNLRTKLGNVEKMMKKKFPDKNEITVYSFISGFKIQRFIFEDGERDGLAFGADLFLGDKFHYSQLEKGQNTFSQYLIRTYNKDHLVKKLVDLWIEDIMGDFTGNRAIDYMIKNGKKSFLIKQLIPEINDTILLEYSKNQFEWLENNEQEMWTHMISNGYFYTTDMYNIKRLTSASPNSQALGMPIASPGQTGNYLGYRIVEKYVKRQSEINLTKLINNGDSQKILESSKFKPKRK